MLYVTPLVIQYNDESHETKLILMPYNVWYNHDDNHLRIHNKNYYMGLGTRLA